MICRSIAATVRSELKQQINEDLKSSGTPCLAVVIVGERKDSQTYVRMKIRVCGFVSCVLLLHYLFLRR
jgi:5,10-methylene-tetrahydrofolate dehydrogenase/methenyl tetrahydrofolate cyclohydrolase